MDLEILSIVIVSILSIIIIVCSIGIVVAVKFQNKQKQKYEDINVLIDKNRDVRFAVKEGLTKEEINKIDKDVNIDILMSELFACYLELENKIKHFDTDVDELVTGFFKEFVLNKIENYSIRGISEVTDGIDLVGYSIIEYSKNKLKFRLTINCFQYKINNNIIVSGSNLQKIEKVLLLEYEKVNNKWLISSCDSVYEKKLSN